MAVVTLVNRSGWPDWFARPVIRWVANLAGIKQPHTLVLVGTSDRLHLAGRYYSGRRYVRVRIHRRWQPKGGFPFTTTYWRYRWAMKYPLINRLEGFVDIVAHECFHATGGHPSRFGSDRAAMEMACETFSKETVERFRREWPTVLRPRVVAELRRERGRSRRPSAEQARQAKVDAINAKLNVWTRRAKLANTKLAKLNRQLRAYERRAAGRDGPDQCRAARPDPPYVPDQATVHRRSDTDQEQPHDPDHR
jgi:hypothetical protein